MRQADRATTDLFLAPGVGKEGDQEGPPGKEIERR